jgi:hypothetical protein
MGSGKIKIQKGGGFVEETDTGCLKQTVFEELILQLEFSSWIQLGGKPGCETDFAACSWSWLNQNLQFSLVHWPSPEMRDQVVSPKNRDKKARFRFQSIE